MRKVIILEGEMLKGFTGVFEDELTPERLAIMKADVTDKLGYKKYHQVLKDAGFDVKAAQIE